jgi:hypothetical protein
MFFIIYIHIRQKPISKKLWSLHDMLIRSTECPSINSSSFFSGTAILGLKHDQGEGIRGEGHWLMGAIFFLYISTE